MIPWGTSPLLDPVSSLDPTRQNFFSLQIVAVSRAAIEVRSYVSDVIHYASLRRDCARLVIDRRWRVDIEPGDRVTIDIKRYFVGDGAI